MLEGGHQHLDAREIRNAPHPCDKTGTFLLAEVECAVRDPADQVIAPVGYEVSRLPHAEQYTTNSPTPPLLLHQWGQTLPTPLPAVSLWHGHNYATTPTLPMGTLLIPVEDSPVADPSLLKQRHKTSCIVVKYVTQIRFRKMCGT